MTFDAHTVFMSGGSRGIGLAIAERLGASGANVALMAKTDTPDARLPGTIHTAAAAIEAAGGRALPIAGDIRDDAAVSAAVERAVDHFGGIDICINNASAVTLGGLDTVPLKRYDLMLDVNVRGTYVVTRACLPHLRRSSHARVLTLSPPLNLARRWVTGQSAYTVSKYGMTLITLGVAADEPTIAANCLWPRTSIATAAVQNVLGGEAAMRCSRSPRIVADAAFEVLKRRASETSGETLFDDDVLAAAGITDLSAYASADADELMLDFFVDAMPQHA